MTIWIVFQRTDFCPSPWEECIYNCVVGVIYCFSFFNLQEGQSRRRAFTFYIIIVTQNVGCLGLFLTLAGVTKSGLVEVAAAMIIGGTVLGDLFCIEILTQCFRHSSCYSNTFFSYLFALCHFFFLIFQIEILYFVRSKYFKLQTLQFSYD